MPTLRKVFKFAFLLLSLISTSSGCEDCPRGYLNHTGINGRVCSHLPHSSISCNRYEVKVRQTEIAIYTETLAKVGYLTEAFCDYGIDLCPRGTQHSLSGGCSPCAPGTFNPSVGSLCVECPKGTKSNRTHCIKLLGEAFDRCNQFIRNGALECVREGCLFTSQPNKPTSCITSCPSGQFYDLSDQSNPHCTDCRYDGSDISVCPLTCPESQVDYLCNCDGGECYGPILGPGPVSDAHCTREGAESLQKQVGAFSNSDCGDRFPCLDITVHPPNSRYCASCPTDWYYIKGYGCVFCMDPNPPGGYNPPPTEDERKCRAIDCGLTILDKDNYDCYGPKPLVNYTLFGYCRDC
jgi:hypothetical protein